MKIFERHNDHVSLDNIKRYLEGQMSSEEMHVFERHLLDCDFCNEAFEGYELSNQWTHQHSLDRLKNRLDNRVKVREKPIWAIAAVAIFLLCFSIVLIFLVLDDPEREISMIEKSEKETIEESMVQPDVLKQSEEVIKEINPEKELKSDEILVESKKEKKTVSSKKAKPPTEIAALPTSSPAEEPSIENEIDSFGTSDAAAPKELEETITDEELAFNFSKDTEAIDLTSNDNVLLERRLEAPANQPLQTKSKTLAAGRSSKRQGTSSIIALDDGFILSSNAQPIGGIDNYRLYLRDSLRYPEEAKSNNIKGEVKLVFNVTKNGDVENLEVVKTLSSECDLEAKRLVLEGQKWSLIDNTLPEDNNVVNLTIQFNLSD